jgi:hypothetical protein
MASLYSNERANSRDGRVFDEDEMIFRENPRKTSKVRRYLRDPLDLLILMDAATNLGASLRRNWFVTFVTGSTITWLVVRTQRHLD